MKSKDALEILVHYATLDDSGFEPHMKIYAKIIERDLEVLEIIKNHSYIDLRDLEDYWVNSDYDTYYDNYPGTTNKLTREEFEALGEYLYGDRQ